MHTSWIRLVRYQASADAPVRYGEPLLSETQADDIAYLAETGQLQVKVCDGSDPFTNLRVTDQVEGVHRLLGPLAPESVPIIRCIGLNYRSHSAISPSHSTVQHPLTNPQSLRLAVNYQPAQQSSRSPPQPSPTTTPRCLSPRSPRASATMRAS